jgi:hypothetical protein
MMSKFATILFLLPSFLLARECPALQDAFRSYNYAEYASAKTRLNAVADMTLGNRCLSDKYSLMGALEIADYLRKQSQSLESADQYFKKALTADPFNELSATQYPALLVRRRFEYNRRKLFPSDFQMGLAENAPNADAALDWSKRDAVVRYLRSFLSTERFDQINSIPQVASALLASTLATQTRVQSQDQTPNGIALTSANLIDRTQVIETAARLKVLFDIEKPYIRLDLRESIEGESSESRVALTSVKKQLQEAGFTVIDETTPNSEAHILIRGNVDASAIRIGTGLGYGATAISNLTMRWADGSDYEFGADVSSLDGLAKPNRREASFNALQKMGESLANHITTTCLKEWNNRQVNGAVYLVEIKGRLPYDDFKKMSSQLSTWALNDPLDNPRFNHLGSTKLYVRFRPKSGDLAQMLKEQGFYNLSKNYRVEVMEAGFNHITLAVD